MQWRKNVFGEREKQKATVNARAISHWPKLGSKRHQRRIAARHSFLCRHAVGDRKTRHPNSCARLAFASESML